MNGTVEPMLLTVIGSLERQGYSLLTGIGGELAVQEVVEGTRGLVLTSEQHHGFLGATHLGRCPGPGPLEV